MPQSVSEWCALWHYWCKKLSLPIVPFLLFLRLGLTMLFLSDLISKADVLLCGCYQLIAARKFLASGILHWRKKYGTLYMLYLKIIYFLHWFFPCSIHFSFPSPFLNVEDKSHFLVINVIASFYHKFISLIDNRLYILLLCTGLPQLPANLTNDIGDCRAAIFAWFVPNCFIYLFFCKNPVRMSYKINKCTKFKVTP